MRTTRSFLVVVCLFAATAVSAGELLIVVDPENNVAKTKTEFVTELTSLGAQPANIDAALSKFEERVSVPVEEISQTVLDLRTVYLVNRYLLLKLQVWENGKAVATVNPWKSVALKGGRKYTLNYAKTCVEWTAPLTGAPVYYTAVGPYNGGSCKFAVGCTFVGMKVPAFSPPVVLIAQKMGTGCDNPAVVQ